jgi:hypothetical protein
MNNTQNNTIQTSGPFIRKFNKQINKNKEVKEIKLDKYQEY